MCARVQFEIAVDRREVYLSGCCHFFRCWYFFFALLLRLLLSAMVKVMYIFSVGSPGYMHEDSMEFSVTSELAGYTAANQQTTTTTKEPGKNHIENCLRFLCVSLFIFFAIMLFLSFGIKRLTHFKFVLPLPILSLLFYRFRNNLMFIYEKYTLSRNIWSGLFQ